MSQPPLQNYTRRTTHLVHYTTNHISTIIIDSCDSRPKVPASAPTTKSYSRLTCAKLLKKQTNIKHIFFVNEVPRIPLE